MTITALIGQQIAPHTLEVHLDLNYLRDRSLRAFLSEATLTTGRVLLGAVQANLAVANAFWRHTDFDLELSIEMAEDVQDLHALLIVAELNDAEGFQNLWSAGLDVTSHLLNRAHLFIEYSDHEWAEVAAQAAPTLLMRQSDLIALAALAKNPASPIKNALFPGAESFNAMTALCTAAADLIADIYDGDASDVLAFELDCLEASWAGRTEPDWDTLVRGYRGSA